MKNNISKNDTDSIDDLLYELAKKDYEPIPEDIHNNIMQTISNLENDKDFYKKMRNKNAQPKFTFKNKCASVITQPARLVAIIFLVAIVILTSIVGARSVSDKFLNKDNVRLDSIGISNEFVFTKEIESALKQNVPLELVQLDDNYYINIHSILLDEVNFFTVFELHSRNNVTDDLRFIIKDLMVTDEKGNTLFIANNELNSDKITGYNHIYNRDNSIKQLFFMFGNDSSNIKELNFSFSNIKIYKYDKMVNDSSFEDINISFDEKNINVPITKNNYNTINEYNLLDSNSAKDFDMKKAIYTNTGLYLLVSCDWNASAPIINIDNINNSAIYALPLKRLDINKSLMLYAYNIKSINDNNITIYDQTSTKKYSLIPNTIIDKIS